MNFPNGSFPYTNYSAYLKKRYGEKTYRISVDAGFSCPNREKGRMSPGCIYCEIQGARAPYLGDISGLKEQITSSAAFLQRRYGAKKFLLYFQAYSGTYAPPEVLKQVYDGGLAAGDFQGLIVSTRPDCITPETADLLAAYVRPDFDVWVELGLQSGREETLRRIRRGHGVAEFTESFLQLRERGVKVAVHLIFGLPGEGREEILETLAFLSPLRPDGVKIHNLHIPFGTEIYHEFMSGELPPLSSSRHLEYVILTLERLPPETVIMRLTCDTLPERLAAPRNFMEKARFYAALERQMRQRGTWQGRLFQNEA